MSPDRWEQVEELFAAALERPLGQRAGYVAAATADPVLSEDVLSLLEAHEGRGRLDSIADQLHGLRPAAAVVPVAELLARLRSALDGRYEVEHELGRGGMAIVLLAHDLKHHRQVALKVLQPDLALELGPARFLQEIAIAAQLTHPHILPLHDSGEADGLLYYVMPYVEGESLRDRLRREGRLSPTDALQITRQVGDALSYAHGRGVVHRDIKPENILFAAGHAVVSDFGIARAMTAAGGQDFSETGVILGTPAYMSPEQAAGEPVDGCTDLYALGCVLYEMLAGEPPFVGATVDSVLRHHRTEEPLPLRSSGVTLPEVVATAIERALAKAPAGRFASAAEFVAALGTPGTRPARPRWLTASVGALVLVGAVVGLRSGLESSRSRAAQSIAVLPFVNLTGDSASEFLTDGISEELISALVRLPSLRVPARASSFFFKGKDLSLRQVGDSLKVANVLEGTVRRAGSRLRITTQLVRVADGDHVWAETYDRDLRGREDLIALEEEIARAIVDALQVTLTADTSTHLVPRHTASRAAHELFLKGEYFLHRRSADDMMKAIQYFERAVALDTAYALAYSGLADAYLLAGAPLDYMPSDAALPRARAAAVTAVALDSTLAEAQTSLARVRQTVDRDWAAAEQGYRTAIALNPGYALAHSWFGLMLGQDLHRRYPEAIRHAKQAEQLDPLSPGMSHNVAIVLLAAERYDEAITYGRKAVELQPDWSTAHYVLGNAYFGNGMLEQATAEYRATIALRSTGTHTVRALGMLGHIAALRGNRPEAVAYLDRLLAMPRTAEGWRAMGILYGGLGENDSAFAALDRARAAGQGFGGVKTNRAFDPLRSDPRFGEFVKQVSHAGSGSS